MKRTQQKIRNQTIDKTMVKPFGVAKNQEKPIIYNKALSIFNQARSAPVLK